MIKVSWKEKQGERKSVILRKVDMAALLLDKVDESQRKLSETKGEYCVMIRGTIYQEDMIILKQSHSHTHKHTPTHQRVKPQHMWSKTKRTEKINMQI